MEDRVRLGVGFWLACGLLLLAMMTPIVGPQMVLADLPTRPEDELETKPLAGAGIALRVRGATAPYAAVVQWVDGLGQWHDVEGWRGQVEGDQVLWYVDQADFGAGPFRWVVYDDQDVLCASEAFMLPEAKGQLVWVEAACAE
jgi:hypothetical protein